MSTWHNWTRDHDIHVKKWMVYQFDNQHINQYD